MFKFLGTAKKKLIRWIVPRHPVPVAKQLGSLEQVAGELVDRSRQGDQNALGSIVATRQEALKGNPVAKNAFAHIVAYANKVPPRQWVSFGEEMSREYKTDTLAQNAKAAFGNDEYPEVMVKHIGPLSMQSPAKAIVTVANGPTLLTSDNAKPRILEVAEKLTPEQRAAFSLGVKYCDKALKEAQSMSVDCKQALALGIILGIARKIQAVRVDTAPIKILCPVAAWELGE